MKAKNTIDQHKEKIALKTLKMPSPMAGVMGQSKDEAIEVLKSLGYSDFEIKNLSKVGKEENKMATEKQLREFVRGKIIKFLQEQKILTEAEKEGKSKPTSGLKKAKDSNTHTEKTKSKNPTSKKVTDGGPENKTLSDAKPDDPGKETKEIEDATDEALLKGKYPGNIEEDFDTNIMGIDLVVKGSSYANINALYLLAQIRKSLEGRGTYVKKVTIEMDSEKNEKDNIKESKKVTKLRDTIKKVIKEELNKKF